MGSDSQRRYKELWLKLSWTPWSIVAGSAVGIVVVDAFKLVQRLLGRSGKHS
jgi:hypothetical protein